MPKIITSENIAKSLIALGCVLIFIFCVISCSNNLAWFQGQFSLENTGYAGSFIGGTAGALWALAGVFYFKSALNLQQEELREQRKANNASIAWSIFNQNLQVLKSLQGTDGYNTELDKIIKRPLSTLERTVGYGTSSQGNRDFSNETVLDDNTENLESFKQELDIAITNTDSKYYLLRMIKLIDIFSNIILEYGDNKQLLVGTLFSQLSPKEVRVIIYKCIADTNFYERAEKLGFFNHFFSHAFRNTVHAKKYFPDYEFEDGFLTKKSKS